MENLEQTVDESENIQPNYYQKGVLNSILAGSAGASTIYFFSDYLENRFKIAQLNVMKTLENSMSNINLETITEQIINYQNTADLDMVMGTGLAMATAKIMGDAIYSYIMAAKQKN